MFLYNLPSQLDLRCSVARDASCAARSSLSRYGSASCGTARLIRPPPLYRPLPPSALRVCLPHRGARRLLRCLALIAIRFISCGVAWHLGWLLRRRMCQLLCPGPPAHICIDLFASARASALFHLPSGRPSARLPARRSGFSGLTPASVYLFSCVGLSTVVHSCSNSLSDRDTAVPF